MFRIRFSLAAFALLTTLATTPLHSAHAQVTCIQATNKVVKGKVVTKLKSVRRTRKCKAGEVLAQSGPQGPTGLPGADGSLRVYGDGSAGAKTIATDTTLTDSNLMFTDFVVNAGQTLTVPSGTVIRCTGEFINRGTIAVSPGAAGGYTNYQVLVAIAPPQFSLTAHPGIGNRSAANGQYGADTAFQQGGAGGLGITSAAARLLRYPGSNAGGGGGGTFYEGGRGGGALTVLCSNGVTNEGTIEADGRTPAPLDHGAGGGGGGVIILASRSFILSTSGSVMSASGGSGRSPSVRTAGGGGGGGGVIHLMAPTITTSGATISVVGGPGAAAENVVTETSRSAGGGGGGSGGAGGFGGTLQPSDPSSSPGGSGANGYSLTSLLDPTSLF